MKERSFDEMIAFFNRRVSEMDIAQDYKMELLGMVTALGYKHEKTAQQWIPCSDHTPDTPIRVQVQLDNGWIITAYRQEGEWLSVPDCGEALHNEWVIAWMPLPEPWKGEQP